MDSRRIYGQTIVFPKWSKHTRRKLGCGTGLVRDACMRDEPDRSPSRNLVGAYTVCHARWISIFGYRHYNDAYWNHACTVCIVLYCMEIRFGWAIRQVTVMCHIYVVCRVSWLAAGVALSCCQMQPGRRKPRKSHRWEARSKDNGYYGRRHHEHTPTPFKDLTLACRLRKNASLGHVGGEAGVTTYIDMTQITYYSLSNVLPSVA